MLADVARLVLPDADVIVTPDGVHGWACMLLFACDRMGFDELAVVPGGSLYRGDLGGLLTQLAESPWQVALAAFESLLPTWPHLRCSAAGAILEASATSLIGPLAASGIMHFRRGLDLAKAAEEALLQAAADQPVGLAEVINELVLAGHAVGAVGIAADSILRGLAPPRRCAAA
jgi:hypothetical protein